MKIYLCTIGSDRNLIIETGSKWYAYAGKFTQCNINCRYKSIALYNLMNWAKNKNMYISLENFNELTGFDDMSYEQVSNMLHAIDIMQNVSILSNYELYYVYEI